MGTEHLKLEIHCPLGEGEHPCGWALGMLDGGGNLLADVTGEILAVGPDDHITLLEFTVGRRSHFDALHLKFGSTAHRHDPGGPHQMVLARPCRRRC